MRKSTLKKEYSELDCDVSIRLNLNGQIVQMNPDTESLIKKELLRIDQPHFLDVASIENRDLTKMLVDIAKGSVVASRIVIKGEKGLIKADAIFSPSKTSGESSEINIYIIQ